MKKLSVFLTLSLVVMIAIAAQADVVVKMKTAANTLGIMNTDGTITEYIRPDMSATENTLKISGSGPMAAVFGNQPDQVTIDIERLDKGVRWDVDVNEKLYSEMELATMKDQMAGEQGGESEMMSEAGDYDWTTQVTNVDDPQDINGFKCKGIIATATGVRKDDPQDKTMIKFEYWFSKDIDGYDVLKEFQKNYADATGMDILESQKDIGQIFGSSENTFKEMFDAMKNVDGYPIKTVVTVRGTNIAAGDVRDEETQKGADPGMMDMFKGMMGGAAGEKSEDGLVTVATVTNEVTSIKIQDVDQTKYEVPEGFEKQ